MPVLNQYDAASDSWLTVGGMGLPLSPVSFSAHKNSVDQTGVTATPVLVTFGTETSNVGSGYDATNSRFCPKIPGLYLIIASIMRSSGATDLDVTVRKNGSVVASEYSPITSGWTQIRIVFLTYMNGSTDYIDVYASCNNATGTIYGGDGATLFQGCLIPDSNQRPVAIIDTTNLGTDYLLQVGETAKVTFSSATSIPVHIATENGAEYEIVISCDYQTGQTGGADWIMSGDSGLQKYEIVYTLGDPTVASAYGSTTTANADWHVGNGILRSAKINFSVRSNAIQYLCQSFGDTNEAFCAARNVSGSWNSTITSLGTLTFADAHSGSVTIRRIS